MKIDCGCRFSSWNSSCNQFWDKQRSFWILWNSWRLTQKSKRFCSSHGMSAGSQSSKSNNRNVMNWLPCQYTHGQQKKRTTTSMMMPSITSRKTIGVMMIQNLHFFPIDVPRLDGRLGAWWENFLAGGPGRKDATLAAKKNMVRERCFEEEPECDMCILLPYLALRISLCTCVYIYICILYTQLSGPSSAHI